MTSLIEQIRQKVVNERFEFSKHAVDQSILRKIQVQEVREAIANGQVIEDYPHDKYGSSCLISGLTQAQRPIHVQCSYPSRPLLKIITLYKPDPQRWNDDFIAVFSWIEHSTQSYRYLDHADFFYSCENRYHTEEKPQ